MIFSLLLHFAVPISACGELGTTLFMRNWLNADGYC
jgi:hypothetical protein